MTVIVYNNAIILKELWIEFGTGSNKRRLPIHLIATEWGQNFCIVLPSVHNLTGADCTSKVGTKYSAIRANPEEYLRDFATGTYIIISKCFKSLFYS